MSVDLSKVNYILLKSDGSVLAQKVEYYIEQGNTGVDKIFFGSLAAQSGDTGIAAFTLPNGQQNTLQGTFTDCTYKIDGVDTTINGFLFTLTTDQTNYNGGLMVSLGIFREINGVDKRYVTYPLYLVVNETGLRNDTDTGVTIEEINSYLRYVQNALQISDGIVVISSLSAVSDWQDYAEGQLFLAKDTGKFEIRTNTSPYHQEYKIRYVPYTGAQYDVDLGSHDFAALNIALKGFLDIKNSTGDYGASIYIDSNNDLHIILANTSDGQTGEIVFPYDIDGTATTKEYVDARVDKVITLASISGNMSADDYNLPNVRLYYNGYYYEKAFISGSVIYFLRLKSSNVTSGDTTILCQHAITVDTANNGAIAQNNSSFAVVYSNTQIDAKFYTKTDMDTALATKVNRITSDLQNQDVVVYVAKNVNGTYSDDKIQVSSSYNGYTIARRTPDGNVRTAAPTNNNDAATKKYVDDRISDVTRDAYSVVDTTTYPTLNDFLASTGEEGYVYLYPIDLNDLTKGYYRYIWENNAWLDFGTTQIDLSDYYTKTETDTLLSAKSNITTTVIDDDLSVVANHIAQIKKGADWYSVAQNVTLYTQPKVVATTSDLPATNDGYLYLVLADGYLYYWDSSESDWVQGYEYVQDITDLLKTDDLVPDYNSSSKYYFGNLVNYNGKLYYCKGYNISGTWDSTKWQLTNLEDYLKLFSAKKTYTVQYTQNAYIYKEDGTEVYYSGHPSFYASNFIELFSKQLILTCIDAELDDSGFAFYDENKTFISGGRLETTSLTTIILQVPNNAKYFRFTIYLGNSAYTIDDCSLYGLVNDYDNEIINAINESEEYGDARFEQIGVFLYQKAFDMNTGILTTINYPYFTDGKKYPKYLLDKLQNWNFGSGNDYLSLWNKDTFVGNYYANHYYDENNVQKDSIEYTHFAFNIYLPNTTTTFPNLYFKYTEKRINDLENDVNQHIEFTAAKAYDMSTGAYTDMSETYPAYYATGKYDASLIHRLNGFNFSSGVSYISLWNGDTYVGTYYASHFHNPGSSSNAPFIPFTKFALSVYTAQESISSIYFDTLNQDVYDLESKINNSNLTKINEITVTTAQELVNAINSIATSVSNNKANKNNIYNIYLNAGTYSLWSVLDKSKINSADNPFRRGLEIPDYVNLIGKQGNVVIDCTIPESDNTSSLTYTFWVSTINIYGSNTFKNLTIIGDNTKYCVHDDAGGTYEDREVIFENVKLWHKGLASHDYWQYPWAYGAGYCLNRVGRFKNCQFKGAECGLLYVHASSGSKMASNAFVYVDNCVFDIPTGDNVGIQIPWSTQNSSTIILAINNCYIKGTSDTIHFWGVAPAIAYGGGNSTFTLSNENSSEINIVV